MALSPQERSRRMRLNMLMAMSYAVAGRSTFTPLSLFSAGEVGAWYDPSDFSTMFQDSAGTTPVTAVEQPVGLILDKSQRLVIGNELITNGSFSDGTGWSLGTFGTQTGSIAGGIGVLPRVDASNFGYLFQQITGAAGWYRVTVTVVGSGGVSVRAGTAGLGTAYTNTAITTGTQTVYFFASAANPFVTLNGTSNGTTSNVDNVSVVSVAGNHAYQTTSTSRPVLKQDENGKYYLLFDGTDDFLVTGTINPGSVDKAQVFAGVRKLSDAARGVVAEFSANITTNAGSFVMDAPQGAVANLNFASRGTSAAVLATSGNVYAAPITNVMTGIGDISGDVTTLRVNGAVADHDTTDQGTGNYGSYPLYIGRRGGTTLPYNGRLYGLIVRFSAANLSSENITNAETWMNARTGAY